MEHRYAPNLLTLALLGTFSAATAQCDVGTPCDDLDSCTVNDVYNWVATDSIVCTADTVEIPNPSSGSNTAQLAAPNGLAVTPFMHDMSTRRFRKQYMILRNEMDLEMLQLGGSAATQGVGDCAPITAIGFYIDAPVTEEDQRLWQYVLTIKHVSLGINNLNSGFDNVIDLASGCSWSNVELVPAINSVPGWHYFNLSTPFVWDGIRNVVVDLAVNMAPGGDANTVQGLPVRYANTVANLTYFAYVDPPWSGACAPAVGIGIAACNPGNVTTSLGSSCGTFGPTPNRPSISFVGGVDSFLPECVCAGTLADTDLDGLADCDDPCPLGLNPGDACDDGNPDTESDIILEDCQCLGIALDVLEHSVGDGLQAWPNPVNVDLVHFDRIVSGVLYDAFGRPVRSVNVADELVVAGLGAGTYMLRTDRGEAVRILRY